MTLSFEGGWYWPRTDHHMSLPFTKRYRSRSNADIPNKKVIDCSTPINFVSRKQNALRWGETMGMFTMNSISHFSFEPEDVPYTSSYSSDDCCCYIWLYWTSGHQSWYWCQAQLGNQYIQNPRTVWAHRINWMAQTARMQAAIFVGCMYFYAYEFMYTYVPYLRIRDPSPEGWKKSWQEGQSTYIARVLACVFPGMAHWLYTGSCKKTPFYFWLLAGHMWLYEWQRPAYSGNHIFYAYRSSVWAQTCSKYGSLVPDPERRADPDTNKPAHAANYKYHQLAHGLFHDDMWANMGNDNFGPNRINKKVANPYFNFQKASQGRNEEPWLTKNQVWEMPDVLSPKILSGANDR